MTTVDTRGMLCPAPLIQTKKALATAAPSTPMEVITDNETATQNLLAYLRELGITPMTTREEGLFRLRFDVLTQKEAVQTSAPETFCNHVPSYVVVIKSENMGEGDEALGRILLRGFINSLSEVDNLPSSIILYNGGIKTALKGTDTAEALQTLEQRGVTVVVCGTCADFFGAKEQLAVGIISNMYKITTLVSQAGHVVYP